LKQAERFHRAGVGTVVITLGEEGSLLLGDRVCLRAGTYPGQFVGGIGAGDAFDAGYIAALVDGADHRECLRWGTALGASCVGSLGATESVFNRQEALAMMSEHILEIKEV
jgi:sugar/nucleoside kinase (ribokinase family)